MPSVPNAALWLMSVAPLTVNEPLQVSRRMPSAPGVSMVTSWKSTSMLLPDVMPIASFPPDTPLTVVAPVTVKEPGKLLRRMPTRAGA